MAEKAVSVVEKGYKALKLGHFGGSATEMTKQAIIKNTIKCVRLIRAAVGEEIEIFFDATEKLTPKEAILFAKELEPFNVGFIEEPIPFENVNAMAKLNNKIDIPVASGERLFNRYDFREVLELQAVDIIQPDLTHVGGILECKKIAAMAEAWYVMVAPHNSGGPISLAASLQLAGCVTNFYILEHFVLEETTRNEVMTEHFEVVDGYIELPKKPGLGTDIIEEALVKYPYREVEWRTGLSPNGIIEFI
jgi:galactonate dehydratase